MSPHWEERGAIRPERFVIIMARPESAENIGLAARAMKNTGFGRLRVVRKGALPSRAAKTAVHAEDILAAAELFPTLEAAVADCGVVFAGTAKPRAAIGLRTLAETIPIMAAYPSGTKVGLLFGNERTGLTAAELRRANFVYTIPQAGRQPSYNLAAAVLLTLYAIFSAGPTAGPERPDPIPRRDQDETIALILRKLEEKGFIHGGNREHVAVLVHDLLGRLTMTEKDRRLLLALFTKGVDSRIP
jgi:TrmH family RNA methyltransferase